MTVGDRGIQQVILEEAIAALSFFICIYIIVVTFSKKKCELL